MTREDIIRMAREAGFDALLPSEEILGRGRIYTGSDDEISDELERFANLVAAAERNKIAQWMIARGYATGHGDTADDLLKELELTVREEERELCAQQKPWVKTYAGGKPNYTVPEERPRQWQGLTDEERHEIREWQRIQTELGPVWAPMLRYLYEVIEAKLKEKNNG